MCDTGLCKECDEENISFCFGYDEFAEMLKELTKSEKENIRVKVSEDESVQVFYGKKTIYITDTYNITWLFFLTYGIVIDDEHKFLESK